MYECVCVRACVYVHMHKRIFVCAVLVRVCVSIYARKCVFARVCLFGRVYAPVHLRMCISS